MSSHLDYEINKELGECYLFMGDMDKAEEYYLKAVGSNGVHPEPYLGLATIAVQRGDLPRALEMYKKAASIKREDKSLAGMALIELQAGQAEAAFGHLIEALEINPENLVALFSLIQAGHSLGRLDQVVPRLNDCLALDPLRHEVRYSLAACLARQGDTAGAILHLERILEQDPGNAAANELYGLLKP